MDLSNISLMSLPVLASFLLLALLALAVLLRANASSAVDAPAQPISVVINLSRRPDRMASFVKTYSASDFCDTELHRIEAVDGSNNTDWSRFLESEALERLVTMQRTGIRKAHPDLTPGAVGCYLSHVQAWIAIAESGAPYGFVFEDDAILDSTSLQRFHKARRTTPPEWDILLMGYQAVGTLASPGVMKVQQFMGLFGYAISADACRSLTRSVFPIRQQLDWELSQKIKDGEIDVYGVYPTNVRIQSFTTDIQTPVME